jgi:hypothetical protein
MLNSLTQQQLKRFGLNPRHWRPDAKTSPHAHPNCVQNREEPSLRLKLTWTQTAWGPRLSAVRLMPF